MSLIKAYNLDVPVSRTKELVKADFITALQDCFKAKELIGKAEIIPLVQYYAEYSCRYLKYVAYTLEEPQGEAATMKFMNSYIATFVTEAGLHYYNKEQGYSIIDKAVQAALDNKGVVTAEEVDSILTAIEDSYIEEEDIPMSVDEA